MAKGIGLIGNFRGKVGNMVGYNLKDSNNKQTQGVRVYQPIVKNPKTFAQAEQRARLAPINFTYRLLKDIIDRGQEGKAYGNKSRLAWLSQAMKAFDGCWIPKGSDAIAPAIVPISKGSLQNIPNWFTGDNLGTAKFKTEHSPAPATFGAACQILLDDYPQLKVGDQITIVFVGKTKDHLAASFGSFVIDPTSTATSHPDVYWHEQGFSLINRPDNEYLCSFIISREGSNGEHLRTTSALIQLDGSLDDYLTAAAKTAAIHSYMSSGSNVDWAEEYEEPVYTDPEP